MRTISGDLIALAKAGHFDVIVHGCNCQCTMGKGIALAIRNAFPSAWKADLETTRGDASKLGTCSWATIQGATQDLVVVNAYTQVDWRRSARPGVHADYDAITACMQWIRTRFPGRRIGLPKIGAGLAGGDWIRISAIIDHELAGEDVTVVEYGAAPNG